MPAATSQPENKVAFRGKRQRPSHLPPEGVVWYSGPRMAMRERDAVVMHDGWLCHRRRREGRVDRYRE